MHAVRLHAFGPAENLTYEKTEDPEPAPGQVRVAVAAAGVHLLDTAIREGLQGPLPELPALPTIPGREVAGTVDALGDGVSEAWLGKRVVAHLGFAPGGYAELAVTDADRLHEIPENLDFAQAVAMIGTGRTTMGILQFAEVTPASVVIVPAAAGGIGTLLVQYARHAGATVIGLAGGPEKVARVRAGGADLAVDYKDPAWPEQVRAYLGDRTATVVFDGVGGDAARAAVDLLGPGGKHVVFGWSGQGLHDGSPLTFTEEELAERGITSEGVLGPVMMQKAGGANPVRTLELRALAEAATGRLTPAVTRFPLAEAAAAHRALESRGTIGKVVLEP
ncbi:zinc-binding dehydrogenase [Streptomyces himalayensis]|uniref:Zinc-binding dehydrogenase n=1 Tax=Streptomyces himalayensis subsp. himalayensis TaxID=2756131 RepID=A0A7W0DLC8_9ACTN|nr:zinc-binding dehydrogenase [Streptomyces himalayensis]MBA2947231.1 zinc-binding dehydrogenase [Streptomyces himalayensis subsp. himalayensis]